MNRRKIENIFAICILTVFMGQIYISPFALGFRLSFAVVALALFLIYFKDYNEFLICTLVGVLMFLFRSFIAYVEVENVTLTDTLLLYLPVLTFYIPYGILFNLLEVRKKFYKPIPFMLSLWVCDSTPNIIEARNACTNANTVITGASQKRSLLALIAFFGLGLLLLIATAAKQKKSLSVIMILNTLMHK